MDWILDPATWGILVVNPDRRGSENYIGPNAFAEAAVAFASGRHIFVLNNIPSSYDDELRAWGARCLDGDIRHLADAFRSHDGAD
jgi:hypothetical protein